MPPHEDVTLKSLLYGYTVVRRHHLRRVAPTLDRGQCANEQFCLSTPSRQILYTSQQPVARPHQQDPIHRDSVSSEIFKHLLLTITICTSLQSQRSNRLQLAVRSTNTARDLNTPRSDLDTWEAQSISYISHSHETLACGLDFALLLG